MNRLKLLFLFASALVSFGAVSAQEQAVQADCEPAATEAEPSALSNEAKAILVLTSFQTGDTSAAQNYVHPDRYIQHNLSAPDGREALLQLIPLAAEGGATVKIHRVLVAGDIVALHTEYNIPLFGGRLAGFDVFRFEDGLIVEHWDNLSPIVDDTANGNTQFDGSTVVTDLDQTQANCRLVQGFVQDVLVGGDFAAMSGYFDGDNYIQHNPMAPNGLSSLGAVLSQMAEQGMAMTFHTVHRYVAQGNFVLVMSEGAIGDQPTAFYDLFRVENGVIAEHWDVISPIPPQSEWQNNNGKF